MKSRGLYDVTFLPQECVPHFLNMTFNDEDVPGSPFNIEIVKPLENNLPVDDKKILGRANQINIVNFKAMSSNLRASIIGPNKNKIIGSLAKLDDNSFKLEYVPKIIGKHKIEVFENDKSLWPQPLIIDIVDPNQVIVNADSNALLGKEYDFTGKIEINRLI